MTIIELPDDQAAALAAKAAAQGLSLEDWFKSLLVVDALASPGGVQSAADIALEEMRKVPADIMASLPKDGASQHDHYLYGWPKKEA
jgi:plasmid stability protein